MLPGSAEALSGDANMIFTVFFLRNIHGRVGVHTPSVRPTPPQSEERA